MQPNLDGYYKNAAKSFDENRLDLDDEVTSHVGWFTGGNSTKGSLLLDVGCGTGRYTASFAKTGATAIGIDRSRDQVAVAVNKVPAIIGNAEKLPFGDATFSIVSYVMMLHQLTDDELVSSIAEAKRVLNKTGRVWIKTCSHDDIRARPLIDIFPSTVDVNLSRYHDVHNIEKYFNLANLRMTRRHVAVNSYTMTGADIYSRFSSKHNTTLHLIPEVEFNSGLMALQDSFHSETSYVFSHQHTLLEFSS